MIESGTHLMDDPLIVQLPSLCVTVPFLVQFWVVVSHIATVPFSDIFGLRSLIPYGASTRAEYLAIKIRNKNTPLLTWTRVLRGNGDWWLRSGGRGPTTVAHVGREEAIPAQGVEFQFPITLQVCRLEPNTTDEKRTAGSNRVLIESVIKSPAIEH